tara:strand:- start:1045 stop:1218 length:174 start_codon:yes stop_codon:yes gene_type:complete
MSMGHKPCPYCNACEAEALIAVDGLIEWFCIGCLSEWTEEPEPITGNQWDDNEQRYL